MTASGLVSLLTDFGPGSAYVGQLHGTLLRHAPGVQIVDLAHDCPPGAVAAGAYILERSHPHFPVGAVHMVVVDPGVGSARKIIAVRAHGHMFIAPDNGLLGGLIQSDPEAKVRCVENPTLRNETVSRTFHGRDLFAPAAAFLASGGAFREVGPETTAEGPRPGPELGADSIKGRVLLVDRFGNLITDVPRTMVQALGDPSRIRVRVGPSFIDALVQTFSDVARGVALIYIGSGDHLEIAVNGDRASDLMGLDVGDTVMVERRG